jgi:hypothetical protein
MLENFVFVLYGVIHNMRHPLREVDASLEILIGMEVRQ